MLTTYRFGNSWAIILQSDNKVPLTVIKKDQLLDLLKIHGALLIQAGTDTQGFHCENATLPFWPHVQWFYCSVAPSRGSQTTLCDGLEAWHCLRSTTQTLFHTKRMQLARNIPERLWKKWSSKIIYLKCQYPHI